MGIFKSKPAPPNRVRILQELVAGQPMTALQMFVEMKPFVPDFPLRALINAAITGKSEDIATAARYYATTACKDDAAAYALCMRLATA